MTLELQPTYRFWVTRRGQRVQVRLKSLTQPEVLGLANEQLRAGVGDLADALYRWQHQMRRQAEETTGAA